MVVGKVNIFEPVAEGSNGSVLRHKVESERFPPEKYEGICYAVLYVNKMNNNMISELVKPGDDYHNEPEPVLSRRCSLRGLCNKPNRKALLIQLLELKENIRDETRKRNRTLELKWKSVPSLLVEWGKHDDVQKVKGVEGLRTLLRLDDRRCNLDGNDGR